MDIAVANTIKVQRRQPTLRIVEEVHLIVFPGQMRHHFVASPCGLQIGFAGLLVVCRDEVKS